MNITGILNKQAEKSMKDYSYPSILRYVQTVSSIVQPHRLRWHCLVLQSAGHIALWVDRTIAVGEAHIFQQVIPAQGKTKRRVNESCGISSKTFLMR